MRRSLSRIHSHYSHNFPFYYILISSAQHIASKWLPICNLHPTERKRNERACFRCVCADRRECRCSAIIAPDTGWRRGKTHYDCCRSHVVLPQTERLHSLISEWRIFGPFFRVFADGDVRGLWRRRLQKDFRQRLNYLPFCVIIILYVVDVNHFTHTQKGQNTRRCCWRVFADTRGNFHVVWDNRLFRSKWRKHN